VSKPLAVEATKTTRAFLIPDQAESHKGRKTLVLDLDETLVHASLKDIENTDITFSVSYRLKNRLRVKEKLPMWVLQCDLEPMSS
jgi:TFIIF-interacting CTD phosphatase-like protein